MASDLSAAHARLLAELLRQRERAGVSTRALAERLGWSQAKVARLERGDRKPLQADVTAWLTALGAPAAVVAEMEQVAHEVSVEAKPWSDLYLAAGGAAERQQKYADLNRAATSIAIFQPAIVPGLAQTAEYARRVLELMPVPRDQIAGMVQAKMARQDVLYEAGREITLLVTEAALRFALAPGPVMVGQVQHLSSLASLENVHLGVVPIDAPAASLPLSAFVLREFPGGEAVVLVETLTAETEISDEVSVGVYRESLAGWRKVALFGAAAGDLLGEIRGRFAGQGV